MNPAIRRNPHKKIKHNKQIAPIVQPVAKVVESPTETLEEALNKIEPPEEILTDVDQPNLESNKDDNIDELILKASENFKQDVEVIDEAIETSDEVEIKKPKNDVAKSQKKGKPGRKGK